MTVTNRVPAAIDYLVATFQAAATLGQATPPVLVLDGPTVTGDPAPLALWVGLDDPDNATTGATAALSTQDWAGLGRMAKNEVLTIHCTAQAWSGDDSIRNMRQAAAAIVSAVEAIVLADATLGGAVTVPGNASVTDAEWRQQGSTRGAMVRVTFVITAGARIGGT